MDPLAQAQQDLTAALRQINTLSSVNEKQRFRISELRTLNTASSSSSSSDKEEARITKLKLAWYRLHLVLSSKLKTAVARAFDRWRSLAAREEARAEMRRDGMKVQVQMSKIKAERGKIERMERDLHRIRMEKACLLLLQRHKNAAASSAVSAIKTAASSEKAALLSHLKSLYHQLLHLNETEARAAEAAKARGRRHVDKVERVGRVLQGFLDGETHA